MNLINFQLVTPEKTVLSKELTSLTCPTTLGEITILPNHAALVAELKTGELHAKTANDDFYVHVGGGFVEVREGNVVIVLADSAEHHFEIDTKRAEEAVKRAKEEMAKHSNGTPEYAKTAAALERSLSRINIARKHAHRKSSIVNQETFNQ